MGLGSGQKSSDGSPEAAAPPRTFELMDVWELRMGCGLGRKDDSPCLAQVVASIFVSQ